jgi:[ribosomal protein S18]-alanine N-acetyltransferase
MKTKCTLRKATEKDIEAVMQIEAACFNQGICERIEVFQERLKIFNEGFYILEKDCRVIGYITTEIWECDKLPDSGYFKLGHSINEVHRITGNKLYISSMGILPEYHSKGLGFTLFSDATQLINDQYVSITSQILIVSDAWKKAKKIYERNNFREVTRLDNFFVFNEGHRENGIVMEKVMNNVNKGHKNLF